MDFLVHLIGLSSLVVIWGGIFAAIAWVLRQLRQDDEAKRQAKERHPSNI